MSRSYRNRKEYAIVKDRYKNRGSLRYYKKQANRKVRKYKYLSNGNMYKKVYETWDIHDQWAIVKKPKDWHKLLGKNTFYNWKYMMCK